MRPLCLALLVALAVPIGVAQGALDTNEIAGSVLPKVAGKTFAGTVRDDITLIMSFNGNGTAFNMLVSWTKSGSFDCPNVTVQASGETGIAVPAFSPYTTMQEKSSYCMANAFHNNGVIPQQTMTWIGDTPNCNGNELMTCHLLKITFNLGDLLLLGFSGLDADFARQTRWPESTLRLWDAWRSRWGN